MVTLLTPEMQAIFLTTAVPPVAIRMPAFSPLSVPSDARRQRQEVQAGRIALVTEWQGASGVWHEVERVVCRPDGVLLEAKQWLPRAGEPLAFEIRHSNIHLARAQPELFRLPAGFRLIEPPPRPPR